MPAENFTFDNILLLVDFVGFKFLFCNSLMKQFMFMKFVRFYIHKLYLLFK